MQIRDALQQPLGGASLAVVRATIGLSAAIAAARLWANGWLDSLYSPRYRLAYPGLDWVPSLDPGQLRLLAAVIIGAGLATAAGWRTRAAAATLAVSFSWLEFIEATTYLNHYWFISSMAALLAVVPAGADLSLDAIRRGRRQVPAWSVWAVRAQVAAVYLFAGVAKLSYDWLVEALPLRLWLPARADIPLIGELLAHPMAASLASWAGAAFDLVIVWFLLHRRTRPWAWGAVVTFHVVTWALFPSIGIFPWVMVMASTVFFSPDWPRRLLGRLTTSALPVAEGRRWAVAAAAALLIIQVALPLRSVVSEADPVRTGEGFRFAWNVLAVEKTGYLRFRVVGPDDGQIVDAGDWFTDNQMRILPTEPRMIVQAAHVIADQQPGPVEVYADSWLSVNGRPEQALIDPTIDLAAMPVDTPASTYVVATLNSAPIP